MRLVYHTESCIDPINIDRFVEIMICLSGETDIDRQPINIKIQIRIRVAFTIPMAIDGAASRMISLSDRVKACTTDSTLGWINRNASTNTGAKTCIRPWKEAPKLVWNSHCAPWKACKQTRLRHKINQSIVVTYCSEEIREKKLISPRHAKLYEWRGYFDRHV